MKQRRGPVSLVEIDRGAIRRSRGVCSEAAPPAERLEPQRKGYGHPAGHLAANRIAGQHRRPSISHNRTLQGDVRRRDARTESARTSTWPPQKGATRRRSHRSKLMKDGYRYAGVPPNASSISMANSQRPTKPNGAGPLMKTEPASDTPPTPPPQGHQTAGGRESGGDGAKGPPGRDSAFGSIGRPGLINWRYEYGTVLVRNKGGRGEVHRYIARVPGVFPYRRPASPGRSP